MEIYLNNLGFTGYLFTGPQNLDRAPVLSNGASPIFRSLILLDMIDAVTREITGDGTIRSHGVVQLRDRDGLLLGAVGGSFPKPFATDISSSTMRPEFGRNIFQIIKAGGNPADVIGHGDTVSFGLIERMPLTLFPPNSWITTVLGGILTRTISVDSIGLTPGATESFQLVVPTDISEFNLPETITIPYQGSETVTGTMKVTGGPGVAAPGGGTAFDILVSDSEFISPSSISLTVGPDQESDTVEISLKEHLGSFSPCETKEITITAQAAATETRLTRNAKLIPGPNPFIRMRLDRVRRVGGCLAGMTPFVPWPKSTVRQVEATVLLRRDPAQLLKVTLSSDDPFIFSLIQDTDELTIDKPIKFVFNVRDVPDVGERYCAILKATLSVNDVEHTPRFAVLIDRDDVIFGP